jgi:hypothetical protein
MPAYLAQIAAGASAAAQCRRRLSPAIRSRSPIAERDQRLTLTDMDWNFEDSLPSDTAASETALPMEPATRIEPTIPEQTPVKPNPRPSSPNPVIEEMAPQPSDSRHQAHRESTSDPLRIPHALIEPSAAASNIPRQGPNLSGKSLASPEQVLKQTVKSSLRSSRSASGSTEHSVQPERHASQMRVPVPAKADAGAPSIVVNTAPQASEASEPTDSARELARVRRPEQPQVMEPRPSTDYQINCRPQPAGLESSHESTRPSVIINSIEVEVVPPASEKCASKPASAAPPRSAPVSQIGPLRRVAKHLAFSIRHH